jgi:hypothetical protein
MWDVRDKLAGKRGLAESVGIRKGRKKRDGVGDWSDGSFNWAVLDEAARWKRVRGLFCF